MKGMKSMTTTIYDLDGIYFRVERDGKWQSLCVSDLTLDELKSVTKDWDCNQLTIVAKELSCTLIIHQSVLIELLCSGL